jgi:hypothetical protein
VGAGGRLHRAPPRRHRGRDALIACCRSGPGGRDGRAHWGNAGGDDSTLLSLPTGGREGEMAWFLARERGKKAEQASTPGRHQRFGAGLRQSLSRCWGCMRHALIAPLVTCSLAGDLMPRRRAGIANAGQRLLSQPSLPCLLRSGGQVWRVRHLAGANRYWMLLREIYQR